MMEASLRCAGYSLAAGRSRARLGRCRGPVPHRSRVQMGLSAASPTGAYAGRPDRPSRNVKTGDQIELRGGRVSHPYSEILKKIGDATIPERATSLLRGPNAEAQESAVEILIDHPSPAALDTLWDLRRALEGDDERFFFRLQVEEALAACVKLRPEWLRRAIQSSDPNQEPFTALVYLLVQLGEIEEGERIWREVRD